MNDLDFLIKFEEIEALKEAMKLLGYLQGEYDFSEGKIKEFSRSKLLAWLNKMNNLPTFIRLTEARVADFILIDFSFAFGLDRDIEAASLVFQHAQDAYLTPPDFFLHLCCHLYKEATSALWIHDGCDLNLIKFCDVREFILQKMKKSDVAEAVEFAKTHNMAEPVYYTIDALRLIYDDGYEADILADLNISDDGFLEHFGKHDFKNEIRWQKSFWARFFSYSNKNELHQEADYLKEFSKFLKL
jgi:hypothetical protein